MRNHFIRQWLSTRHSLFVTYSMQLTLLCLFNLKSAGTQQSSFAPLPLTYSRNESSEDDLTFWMRKFAMGKRHSGWWLHSVVPGYMLCAPVMIRNIRPLLHQEFSIFWQQKPKEGYISGGGYLCVCVCCFCPCCLYHTCHHRPLWLVRWKPEIYRDRGCSFLFLWSVQLLTYCCSCRLSVCETCWGVNLHSVLIFSSSHLHSHAVVGLCNAHVCCPKKNYQILTRSFW